MDVYLSPSETARRLGVTVKALRLYEGRGLVKPLRTNAGWRAYGPDQLARVYQILALKRLGLPLARISDLLSGGAPPLAEILAVQETALRAETERVSRALDLIRAAQAKLASGAALSIDDLTTLTRETTMSETLTDDGWKAVFEPHFAKHYTPEEMAAFARRKRDAAADGTDLMGAWPVLMEEARRLMALGDPVSPAALNLARHWRSEVRKFTQGDPAIAAKVQAVWKDAMDGPDAGRLPINAELWAFVGRAGEALKTSEPEGA